MPHRHLCLRVPLSRGCARQVFLADQCGLNLSRATGIYGTLTVDAIHPLALFRGCHLGMTRGGCAMGSAAKCWSDSQCAEQKQSLACSERRHAYLDWGSFL